MFRIPLLILSFFLANLAVAAEPQAVSIKSFICGTDRVLESSGTLIRYQNKNYVLTSSWGVLEDRENICHEIKEAGRDTIHKAQLSVLDWAGGFALLEVEGLKADVDLESDFAEVPSVTASALSGKNVTQTGRIASKKSTRHHFPALSFAYEFAADKLEVSFIGAPVTGEHLYGIVSSLRVEIVAGSRALIQEWQNNDKTVSKHIFVLPLSQIRERLKKIDWTKRSTYQRSESKLGKREQIFVGPLEWHLNCPEGAGKPPKDGIGPIGGADGVGVGGSMKGVETCSVDVKDQVEHPLESPDFLPAKTLQEWLSYTNGKRTFTIPYLFGRTPGKEIARNPFFSLPHYFMEAKLAKLIPVFVPKSGQPKDVKLATLYKESEAFRKLLVDTYSLVLKEDDERIDYRYYYALSLLLTSEQWKLPTMSDMQGALLTLENPSWAAQINYKGESLRIQLLEQLKKVYDELRRVGGGF